MHLCKYTANLSEIRWVCCWSFSADYPQFDGGCRTCCPWWLAVWSACSASHLLKGQHPGVNHRPQERRWLPPLQADRTAGASSCIHGMASCPSCAQPLWRCTVPTCWPDLHHVVLDSFHTMNQELKIPSTAALNNAQSYWMSFFPLSLYSHTWWKERLSHVSTVHPPVTFSLATMGLIWKSKLRSRLISFQEYVTTTNSQGLFFLCSFELMTSSQSKWNIERFSSAMLPRLHFHCNKIPMTLKNVIS